MWIQFFSAKTDGVLEEILIYEKTVTTKVPPHKETSLFFPI